jgi:DNA-binding LacI/PurR family transcriptional regulator
MLSHDKTERIEAESPISVRNQLLTILTKQIDEGAYAPGQRFPSERVLAERFSISRASVRETVAQMIAQGILVRLNGRGTFVNDKSDAVGLHHHKSRQLGFWISDRVFHFVQAGYNQILSGFTEICRLTGCRLRFYPVPEGAGIDLPDNSGPDRLDGSIVVGGLNRDLIERLNQLGTPLILVDLLNSTDGVSISIDYAKGTRSAIDYLRELGHDRIGFIGFPNSSKYISYWQSLQAHGLSYNPQHVEFFDSSDLLPGMLAGYRAMQKLIARNSRPTAVLITNDYAAVGAIEALTIAGLSVPNDISIIGYDDLGQAATPLTTIRCNLIEVGRTAAQQLLRWIQTDRRPGQTTIPVELVIRASTGPPYSVSDTADNLALTSST